MKNYIYRVKQLYQLFAFVAEMTLPLQASSLRIACPARQFVKYKLDNKTKYMYAGFTLRLELGA